MPGQLTFEGIPSAQPRRESLGEGAWLLRGLAGANEAALLEALRSIVNDAPFRNMHTPGGHQMSVAMTNCGALGWITDRRGYRYDSDDPATNQAWPPMPAAFSSLASVAATAAGYPAFVPDACLINRYEPGARMTLHQDKNERDFRLPIVSVSLGLPATFLFGGDARTERPLRVALEHGDVVVWGGPSRLRYHGVLPLKDGEHALLGRQRINLTFRKAG